MERFVRGGRIENIEKPCVIIDHTQNMGGVDRANNYTTTYGLETNAVNEYVLYKLCEERPVNKPISHYKFIKKLVMELVESFRHPYFYGRLSSYDKEQSLNGKLHIINQLPEGKK